MASLATSRTQSRSASHRHDHFGGRAGIHALERRMRCRNQTLLLQQQITELHPPRPETLRTSRSWLSSCKAPVAAWNRRLRLQKRSSAERSALCCRGGPVRGLPRHAAGHHFRAMTRQNTDTHPSRTHSD